MLEVHLFLCSPPDTICPLADTYFINQNTNSPQTLAR
jgi:hypothetical protein